MNKIERALENWDVTVQHMNDELREICHMDYAPCTNEYFLEKYMRLDEHFVYVLNEIY